MVQGAFFWGEKGDGGSTECECTSHCEVYEHNVDCRAPDVIGQDWSSEVVSLFLEDWELLRVALSCQPHGLRPCQEMKEAYQESSLSQY